MRLISLVIVIIVLSSNQQASAQTRRLVINSFNGGPSGLTTNALGLPQTIIGGQASIANAHLQISTVPGQAAAFSTALTNGASCLSVPPQSNVETFLSFRLQAPAGVDMSIILETGTNGCGGLSNKTASVRLSSYEPLTGQDGYVRIPLTDFPTLAQDWFNGRLRAITFVIPALPYSAVISFDDCQLVARPRQYPLVSSSDFQGFISSINQGPPSSGWGPIRSDGRCGPQFGWAGCSAGACCSARGFCGSTPLHCLSIQTLLTSPN